APTSCSAAVTSSTLNGLMVATMSFTRFSLVSSVIQSTGTGARPRCAATSCPVGFQCLRLARTNRDVELVLDAGVGLGAELEVGVRELSELALVEAGDLDLGVDAHLHELLDQREDDPHGAPRPDEVDDHADHLCAELAGVAVEQALHAVRCRRADAVPADPVR